MPRSVIDENMPRSTGAILEEYGHDVQDVKDYGLRGTEDEKIYQFAQKEKAGIQYKVKGVTIKRDFFGLENLGSPVGSCKVPCRVNYS